MNGHPAPSRRLADATVLVFGGGAASESMTIGQASAIAYAQAGARVVIADLVLGNAERSAAVIAALGGQAAACAADVGEEDSVAEAVAFAHKTFERIEILHNNVGQPMARSFQDYGVADWERAMRVNCIGAATAIRLALPDLLDSHGVIVNVSSIAAIRHTGMHYAAYNASKAALDQLTVAVALEYAHRGLRANAILPGLIDTELGNGLVQGADDAASARAMRSPNRKQGDVWDVANAAVFLASDEAKYINGHLLVVDGGLSRRC